MAIGYEYFFSYIAPGTSISLFIHGYGNREFVSYNILPLNVDVPSIGDARATFSVGETIQWSSVDGTIGRIVNVANTGPNAIEVQLLKQSEFF